MKKVKTKTNWRKTIKNKICAVIFLLIGLMPILIDGDGTLMLFTLFKLKDDPKYSTLSELCYILDGDNLTRFLKYFGGLTIKIPTLRDMRLLTQTLLLYQYVNIDKDVNFKKALEAVCGDEFTADEVKESYSKLLEVVSEYSFNREGQN